MMEALIAGERDPQALAALAKGRMRVKRAALLEALTGRFDEHHAELLRILLDQVDALTEKIEVLSAHIEKLIEAIPAAQPPPMAPPLPMPWAVTRVRCPLSSDWMRSLESDAPPPRRSSPRWA
jgi:transposase